MICNCLSYFISARTLSLVKLECPTKMNARCWIITAEDGDGNVGKTIRLSPFAKTAHAGESGSRITSKQCSGVEISISLLLLLHAPILTF